MSDGTYRDGAKGTTMNDYTVRLMANERALAFEREAEGDRLVTLAKQSNDGTPREPAPAPRRLGVRHIPRRWFALRSL